ncbi:hypothetical protein ABZ470_27460 [Streptosporangium sp. NPDC020072]|uniref:hypothetical protein n=1 Tax=Streptosporangium sp. NPDC020072 TaxID=3154788 RepID=UPI00342B1FAF
MPPLPMTLRLLRALAFTTACLAVSAGGHAFSAGASLSVAALAAGAAGLLVVVLPLVGREHPPAAVVGTTIGAQVLLHELFARTSGGFAAQDGHGHQAVGMALAHLAVGAMSGWWLHRGESAFWLMLRLLRPSWPLLLRPPSAASDDPPTPRPVAPASWPPSGLARRWLTSTIHRRGPPADDAAPSGERRTRVIDARTHGRHLRPGHRRAVFGSSHLVIPDLGGIAAPNRRHRPGSRRRLPAGADRHRLTGVRP